MIGQLVVPCDGNYSARQIIVAYETLDLLTHRGQFGGIKAQLFRVAPFQWLRQRYAGSKKNG